jgi:hypothetical protein
VLDKTANQEYFNQNLKKLEELGEKTGVSKETMKLIKENLTEDWKKSGEQINKLLKTGKSGIAEMLNTKAGFISWCANQKPPKIPDSAYPWSETPIEGSDVLGGAICNQGAVLLLYGAIDNVYAECGVFDPGHVVLLANVEPHARNRVHHDEDDDQDRHEIINLVDRLL